MTNTERIQENNDRLYLVNQKLNQLRPTLRLLNEALETGIENIGGNDMFYRSSNQIVWLANECISDLQAIIEILEPLPKSLHDLLTQLKKDHTDELQA